MKNLILILTIIIVSTSSVVAQKRSDKLIKAIETEDPEAYNEIVKKNDLSGGKGKKTIEATIKKETEKADKSKVTGLKEKTSLNSTKDDEKPVKETKTKGKASVKDKVKDTPKVDEEVVTTDETKEVKGSEKTDEVTDKEGVDSIEFSIPEANKPINTAVSNGVPIMENEDAVAARELKYKAPESEVEKYIALRKKFELEAAEQKVKDELAAKEKAAKELKEYNDRHATPKDINEFEQFRNGQKQNENVKKEKTAQEEYNSLFD